MKKLIGTIGKALGTPDNYICEEIDPTYAETISYFGRWFKSHGLEIAIGLLIIGLLEHVIL